MKFDKTAMFKRMNIFEICRDKITRTDEQIEGIAYYLSTKIPFFSSIQRGILMQLCRGIRAKEFTHNESIMRQGEEADCLYVLYEGLIDIQVNKVSVAEIKGPTVFGEAALMDSESSARTASIFAKSTVKVLIVYKE